MLLGMNRSPLHTKAAGNFTSPRSRATDNWSMTAILKWHPSSVLSFEVNATTSGVTYTITRHTPAGYSQGFYFAYAEDASLGQFEATPDGLEAAKRTCQAHADTLG